MEGGDGGCALGIQSISEAAGAEDILSNCCKSIVMFLSRTKLKVDALVVCSRVLR